MVRIVNIQYFSHSRLQRFTDQNMVNGPLWLPGRIGSEPASWRFQGKGVAKFHDMRRVDLGIEIAQHDKVPTAVQFPREKVKLQRSRPLAQRQVHNGDIETLGAITKPDQ